MVFTLEEGQLKIEGKKNRGVRWTTSGPFCPSSASTPIIRHMSAT